MIKYHPLRQALASANYAETLYIECGNMFSVSTGIVNQSSHIFRYQFASIQTRVLGSATNIAQSKLAVPFPSIQN